MPDLGVYNFTTLTGLLGPAKAVTAMTSIVTPRRAVEDKGDIKVEAEDNASVLMDHGNGVISHVMCGFNYFDPHGPHEVPTGMKAGVLISPRGVSMRPQRAMPSVARREKLTCFMARVLECLRQEWQRLCGAATRNRNCPVVMVEEVTASGH